MQGGAGTHIRGTIRGFEENGHEVLSFILGDEMNSNKEENAILTNSKLPSKINQPKDILPQYIRSTLRDIRSYHRSYAFSKRILPLIKKFDPDIIYERSCIFSTVGNDISKKLNKPLYLETSGCLVEIFKKTYGLSSARIANMLEKRKLNDAHVVVTEAESAVNTIKKKFDLKNKKIIAKPLGVEFPIHTFKKYKSDILTVGYIGTFATYHQVELLLPVFEFFKHENIKFILIGSGGNRLQVENWVREKEINNVEFPGYLKENDLNDYMNRLDIGLVPNCEEHMAPIKTFEYGVYNICPMVPNYEAFKNLIKNGEEGIVFSPNSSESIKQNLEDVLSGSIEHEKCAVRWNNVVSKNFRWNQVVLKVLADAQEL